MKSKKTAKTEKASKKEVKEPKMRGRKAESYPVSKIWKKDKENCGFRPGTFSWAVYQVWTVLKKNKEYSVDEISRKVKMLCQSDGVKIKFNAPRVTHSLALLRRRGLVAKVGPDTFAKTLSYVA